MTISFSSLLNQLDGIVEVRGLADPSITGVSCDSRAVKPGDIFVAVTGAREDGRKYIPQAIAAGACVVVAEGQAETGDAAVPVVQVKHSARALSEISNLVYGQPSSSLKVVGVTGTNGKTTVAYITHHLMRCVWHRAGLLGTVVYDDGLQSVDADRTTPGANAVQAMLGTMLENGCRGVAMEVSSHGLEQLRVASVQFDVGIFTNLTQDHLDYHGTMDAYYRAKKRLADQMIQQHAMGGKPGVMIINTDDSYGRRLAGELEGKLRILTFGFGARCDYRVLKVETLLRGTRFALQAKGREFLVNTPYFGRFNIYNAVAALAAADGLGLNFREAVKNLERAPQVPGRMENVLENRPFRVIVDYAHTPDALANVLATLKELKPARLITVIGCGGDRDREKRPQMGRIACEMSDACLFTSDNPRSEDPQTILREIEAGAQTKNYRVVVDRAEAIRLVISQAKPKDIILLAGKGHETYQEQNGQKLPFDDRLVARWADKERAELGGDE